jgi:hypothetical protein
MFSQMLTGRAMQSSTQPATAFILVSLRKLDMSARE